MKLKWLADLREERKISQYAAADMVGICQSHYAAIEIGNRRPSVQVAKRIAAEFAFDWTRFFEEDAGSV